MRKSMLIEVVDMDSPDSTVVPFVSPAGDPLHLAEMLGDVGDYVSFCGDAEDPEAAEYRAIHRDLERARASLRRLAELEVLELNQAAA